MGRKPIDDDLKKTKISIAIRKETIKKLQELDNYNALIQKLLDDYFKDK
jgi:hypothetical protein